MALPYGTSHGKEFQQGWEGRKTANIEASTMERGVTVSNTDRAGLETLDLRREPQSPGDTVHCQAQQYEAQAR